jgi:asparagine synthase (glutamine-hydrolysing)
MCGIAGFVSNRGGSPGQPLLKTMCDRLAHRGPDSAGYYAEGAAGLGHRRLSIIDLSTGDQPLGNEDGSIQIVFNGEIYNYLELRAELIEKGHRFRTKSDTETIVHLYEEEGEKTPERLNGMFAFAIWDAPRQRLFLARDRLGKKPVYYTTSIPGMRLCFASELKALTVIPGFDAALDERAVADFLSFSYIPAPATIYRKVSKLPAAHTLMASPEGISIRRYWKPAFSSGSAPFDATAGQLEALCADAVERRMISDVPLGAFLSGGVDSSATVAFMANHSPGQVKTFSIGFTNKTFDELEFARAMVSRYHTAHREQVVTPVIHDVLDVLVNHYDEPFGDSSAIPTLYLSKMVREHVTVALSGDGADEMFGGYRRYYYGVFEECLRNVLPASVARPVFRTAARWYPKFDYLPQVFRGKTLLGNLAQDLADAYYVTMSTFRDEGLNRVLSPDLQRTLGGYSPRESYRDRFQAVRELTALQQMQSVDLDTYLPEGILVKVDRASMAYSLEVRCPWLDYRIVELACSLPDSFKLRGKKGKFIFKKAIERHVPSRILTRSKMGFSVPLAEWLRTSLKPTFETVVLNREMDYLLRRDEVTRIWNEHQSRLHNHEQKLWNLLMLACWNSRHNLGEDLTVQASKLEY